MHFVTMSEGLSQDGIASYLDDGIGLFLRLIKHPQPEALADHVRGQVNFRATDSGDQPDFELHLWPFRMAQQHLACAEAADEPSAEVILQLLESVFSELFAALA